MAHLSESSSALRPYVIVDVFTDQPYGGNPLAVVLEAQGLSTAQMQRIAREFGYSETTFVFPSQDAANTAQVRIFTPIREIPFAGHPNIGTAFVIAQQARSTNRPLGTTLRFEEGAGLVQVIPSERDGKLSGAELTVPQPLSRFSKVGQEDVAACLSLSAQDIEVATHAPEVASVGLPFLIVELASRAALKRCVPDPAAYRRLLPLDDAFSIYAYTREADPTDPQADLHARMFTGRMTEDPATGSATAATVALLAALQARTLWSLRVSQGVDMGRPSILEARLDHTGQGIRVAIGGHCVAVMEGRLAVPSS